MARIHNNPNRQRCFDLSAGKSLKMMCVTNDYIGLDPAVLSSVQSQSGISVDPAKQMPPATSPSKQGSLLGFLAGMASGVRAEPSWKPDNLLAGLHGWGGGARRRCQRRRSCCWGRRHASTSCVQGSLRYLLQIGNALVLANESEALASSSGVKKGPIRWSTQEVRRLVEGATVFGMRKWGKVKKVFFGESDRTRMQLKDKWRDIGIACGIDVGSKNKVQPHKATGNLLAGLEEEIKSIYAKDAAMIRKAT